MYYCIILIIINVINAMFSSKINPTYVNNYGEIN